jgi:hypothetical protein
MAHQYDVGDRVSLLSAFTIRMPSGSIRSRAACLLSSMGSLNIA